MKRSLPPSHPSPSTSSSSSSCVLDDQPLKQTKRPRKRANPEQCRQKGKPNSSISDSTNANSNNSNRRSSVYRGVTRHRWTGRFEAHLWDKSSYNSVQNKKGKQVYLGAYDCEQVAARTYDLAALKYWGPDTILNFPRENYTKELEEMQNASKEEYLASLRRRSSGFSRGVSKYRGVAKHHHNGRWEARIGRVFGNKYLYLGTFSSQEEAAKAYDLAAIQYRGRNAVTNFDISNYIPKDNPQQQEDSEIKSVIEQPDEEEQIQEQEPEQEEVEEQKQSPVSAALTDPSEEPELTSQAFDHAPMLAIDRPGCDHECSDDDPWSFCLDAAGYDPPLVHHVLNVGDGDSNLLDLLDEKAFEDDVHLIFDDEHGLCQIKEEKIDKSSFDSSSPSSSSTVTCVTCSE